MKSTPEQSKVSLKVGYNSLLQQDKLHQADNSAKQLHFQLAFLLHFPWFALPFETSFQHFQITSEFNPINRYIFSFEAKFSVFRKYLKIFHVELLYKISVIFFQKSAPGSSSKRSAWTFFLFKKFSDFSTEKFSELKIFSIGLNPERIEQFLPTYDLKKIISN